MKFFFAFLISFLNLATTLGQVSVQPISDADMIAFLQGSGIVLSNLQINCDSNAYGAMTSSAGNFPMGSGIVLSTGNIPDLPQASGNFASTFFSSAGDNDITSSVIYQSYDACSIEFDAVPSFSNIFFEYVFASEEYPEFVCSFNDAFMLLISGPGINGPYSSSATNIALLPDGNSIVSINTVHDTAGAGVSCMTPFDSLYIDNSSDTNIVFDGFTKVLTAGISLQAGQSYHFKIVVADVMDGIFDSGVFLRQSSFRSMGLLSGQEASKAEPLFAYPNPSQGGLFRIDLKDKNEPASIEVFNISGQKISAPLSLLNSGIFIHLENFPSGVYFTRIGNSTLRLIKM